MKLKSTSIYVERGGFYYGCHREPSGNIVCGACGSGSVKDGRCKRCGARQAADAAALAFDKAHSAAR